MVAHVVDDHRALGADGLLDLRVPLELHPQVADGRVLVDGDHAPLVLARGGEHEGAVRQPERLADPSHERLENLVGAQRGGDLLEDVEQEITRAQRLACLLQLPPDAEVGVDAGAELTEMHGARHRVLGAGLERIRHRLGTAVRHEDDHGDCREAGRGGEVAHRVRESRLPGAHGEDQQIGRVLVGPVRGRGRIRRLGDLESAADQEALEAVRPGGWVADEEDAKLRLLGQPVSRTFGGVSSYSSRYGTATAERGT
ncbi:MAG: hypothetical protein AUH78_14385 [Gemmatimonadetes bacterium 13_1_40CM_4_69_8]|nr:MAG: hypothetical protein AUH78_14385 [Gemmatimonadetes bacterium 13_1_40CM_4_69_8]